MNKRICVIEDNPVDFFLLKKLIAHYIGVDVNVDNYFPSVTKAIEAAKAGKLKECVVLVDLDLPVFSGWHFIEEFSKLEPSALVFIVTVSQSNTDFKKANSYAAVKGFFSKPLTAKHLAQIADMVQSMNHSSAN